MEWYLKLSEYLVKFKDILTTIAVIGCAKLIFDSVFSAGRWSKSVEPRWRS